MVVDSKDVNAIFQSQYWAPLPSMESRCNLTNGKRQCGRVDVNQDGKVNQLDVTSVVMSARLGTKVPCGGVYATSFSCGSTRRAPLTPAIDVSFDSVVYFADDGLIGSTSSLNTRRGLHLMSAATPLSFRIFLVEVENLHVHTRQQELEVHDLKEFKRICEGRRSPFWKSRNPRRLDSRGSSLRSWSAVRDRYWCGRYCYRCGAGGNRIQASKKKLKPLAQVRILATCYAEAGGHSTCTCAQARRPAELRLVVAIFLLRLLAIPCLHCPTQ